MTREEAISFLECGAVPDCCFCSRSKKHGGDCNGENGVIEAINIAIKALKKQIPKKIKKQQWMDTKCECGYCFSEDYEDGYYSIPYKNMTKFCPNCGQKLDWSDTE